MKIAAALCLVSLASAGCNGRAGSANSVIGKADEVRGAGDLAAFEKKMVSIQRSMTLLEVFQSLGLMNDWSDDFAEAHTASGTTMGLGEADLPYDLADHKWLNRMVVTVVAIPPDGVEVFDPVVPEAKVVAVDVMPKTGKSLGFRYDDGRYVYRDLK